MPWLNVVLVLFSLLNLGLAIYGYLQGSTVSLIAGVVIGALMLASVALAQSYPRWGRILSLILALAVVGRFLPLFLKSKDWLPAGILAVSGIIVIICLVMGHVLGISRKGAIPDAK